MYNKFNRYIVKNPKKIVAFYIILTIMCVIASQMVNVNTNIMSYLPDELNSEQSKEKLADEFGYEGSATLLLKDVDVVEALKIKNNILEIDGVKKVVWLDDYVDINTLNIPNESTNITYINKFYKDDSALLQIIFEERSGSTLTNQAICEINDITSENGYLTGSSILSKSTIDRANNETPIYTLVAIILILLILLPLTSSYIEPILFLFTVGVAIIINMGTNIFQGEISQITFSSAIILQLAVSMDYSIFLLHRFREERAKGLEVKDAMTKGMKLSINSILPSGITTIAGFIALVFMDFEIGLDLGIVLAKGIIFSLIAVMTLLPSLIILLEKWIEKSSHKDINIYVGRITNFVMKYRYVVVIFAIIISGIFFQAQSNTSYYYSTEKMVPFEDSAIVANEEIKKVYGESNSNRIIIPKTDGQKEIQLMNEIDELSFVESTEGLYKYVPTEIPKSMIPVNLLNSYQSEDYSLIKVNLNCEFESEEAFQTVEEVRDILNNSYEEWYAAGSSFSYYDIAEITNDDFRRNTILSILFIFVILAFTYKSMILPLIAIFVIELAIWINIGYVYFSSDSMSFLSFIIVGAIQLGATVDYAILYISRYKENLESLNPIEAVRKTERDVAKSILTSASILVAGTFSVYFIATLTMVSEMCLMIGRGAIISVLSVFFVLPAFLVVFNPLISRVTKKWPTKK